MASNSLRNYTEFFREEQDVWIKSLVPGQVSLGFELSPGNQVGVLVPYSGDPICLTDQVPFEAIKKSMDLRKLCNPRRVANGGMKPAALMLLTPSQAEEHFEKKAIRKGLFKKTPTGEIITNPETSQPVPDTEAASQPLITEPAVTPSSAQVEFGVSKSQEAMDAHSDVANIGKEGKIMMADAINPRVLHLCNQVKTAENDSQRPLADTLIDEFEAAGQLNEATLNHILATGYYKTVKAWASEQLKALVADEEE